MTTANDDRVTEFLRDGTGDRLVFKGTRVPVSAVWDYVDCGDDEEAESGRFLKEYPCVSREQLDAFLFSKYEIWLHGIDQCAFAFDAGAVRRALGPSFSTTFRWRVWSLYCAVLIHQISRLAFVVIFPLGVVLGMPRAGLAGLLISTPLAFGTRRKIKRMLATWILEDLAFADYAARSHFIWSGWKGDFPREADEQIRDFALLAIGVVSSFLTGMGWYS